MHKLDAQMQVSGNTLIEYIKKINLKHSRAL